MKKALLNFASASILLALFFGTICHQPTLKALAQPPSWEYTTSLNTTLHELNALAVGNNIYAFSGTQFPFTYVQTPNVERTVANPDGSLAAWQFTSPLNIPRVRMGTVYANGFIYAIGGYHNYGSPLASVERAAVNSDGSLGAWQVVSNMSTARREIGVVYHNGYIYVTGGANDTTIFNAVERAQVNPDGSLGTWENVSALNAVRARHSAVVTNGFIYVLGGLSASSTSLELINTVERVAINPDGSLGTWQIISSTPQLVLGGAAVVTNGYIYALGGSSQFFSLVGFNNVQRSVINLDGSLGTWEQVVAMQNGREGLG